MTFPPEFRPLRPAVATLALLAWPAAALAADEPPDASFSFSPEDPRAGQPVRFELSSRDPDGPLVREAWDLDGDRLMSRARRSASLATWEAGRFGSGVSSAGSEPVRC